MKNVIFVTRNCNDEEKKWDMSAEEIFRDWYAGDASHFPAGDDPVLSCQVDGENLSVHTVSELVANLNSMYWKDKPSSSDLPKNVILMAKIRFNRPVDPTADFVSIGSFNISTGESNLSFDMMDTAINIDKEDASLLYYCGKNLDTESFPESKHLHDTVAHMNALNHVSVEVETNGIPLFPVQVECFSFFFESGQIPESTEFVKAEKTEDGCLYVVATNWILDAYNENLHLEQMSEKAEELYHYRPSGRGIVDGDTLLKDQIDSLYNDDYTGIFSEIIKIWNSADMLYEKELVQKMFEAFTGMKFADYLEKCIKETTRA